MTNEIKSINWRKLPVYRDKKFEPLLTLFGLADNDYVGNKGEYNKSKDVPIFKTIKELMVLAALIGYHQNKYAPISNGAEKISILLETYETTKDDTYIYLLALAKEPTLDHVKDVGLKKAIEHFEAFCNAGLEEIMLWAVESEYDTTKFKRKLVDVILKLNEKGIM